MCFQETFNINYYYHYCYYAFIPFWQKKSNNLEKKLIKVSQKRGKIMYLHKNVKINFSLNLKFYKNFKIHHARRLNKTYLVKMFCMALRTVFWNLGFYFYPNVHKLIDSFAFIWNKIPCHSFLFLYHIFPFGSSGPELWIYSQGVWFFEKFENIIHELRF